MRTVGNEPGFLMIIKQQVWHAKQMKLKGYGWNLGQRISRGLSEQKRLKKQEKASRNF